MDVRLKFKDLSKQNQALSDARESYFTVLKDNARLKSQARVSSKRNLTISNSQSQLSLPAATNKLTFKSTRHSHVKEGCSRFSPKPD
jgi:hypothetical protein